MTRYTVRQLCPSDETWISYFSANAVSHRIFTPLITRGSANLTCHHSLSLKLLHHRVFGFPSMANFAALSPLPDDAVASVVACCSAGLNSTSISEKPHCVPRSMQSTFTWRTS